MATSRHGKLLYKQDGVFVHTTVVKADEDALISGHIFLHEKPEGRFVEWKSDSDLFGSTDGSSQEEWAVIDAVGYKPEKLTQPGGVTMQQSHADQQKSTPSHPKYVINFDVTDLKSLRRSQPSLGWSYLIFILKCGTTYPALHFHKGGTKKFIKELENYMHVKRSSSDPCLYLIRQHDPEALSQSFDELNLFVEQSGDVISKFIRDPYTATWGGFSKVTNILRDAIFVPEETPKTRQEVKELSQIWANELKVSNLAEPGFEVVTCEPQDLPPRGEIKRGQPLTSSQWSRHMDQEGKIIDVDCLKNAIFAGGIEPKIRIEVWKFLLGCYSWDSTYQTRTQQRKNKVDDYFRMKLQWKSVSIEQERRFATIRDRKSLIDKDVTRTDRTHQFFQGDKNPNIDVLYDVLMTYCMYNFDLGYVQGMSDLLAPILVVMENEVDAFWCFAGIMDLMENNFQMDQEGMKKQLTDVHTLLKFIDPDLYNHLESKESGNMYFCFRWLLIMFKREFSFPDVMRLWEVIWTGKPCQNFHLLISVAILDTEKNTLIENNFGFTEVLKHINDLSLQINLEETLEKAEAIYIQLRTCQSLPPPVCEILGMQDRMPTTPSSNGASAPSTPERSRKVIKAQVQKSATELLAVTPDDSSIEIIAENLDTFL